VVAVNVSDAGVRETAGAAAVVPVPLRATVCGEPVALSATDSVAVKLAADAGLNVTEIEQLAFATSELLQLLVCAKSVGFVPAIEIPEIVSAALPVFFSVTVCAAEVVPDTAENVRELGDSEATGAAAVVPVPLKATVCGEPVALSATESVAVKLAADAGVNVTEIAQLALAASELPQVLVCAKSLGFVPAIEIPEIVSAALPVFFSVTTCAALVEPVFAVNVNVDGESETAGALVPAEMTKFTGADVPPPGEGFVTVTGTVAALATSAAGITAVSWVAFT
jgi:hypothetical protein